MRALVTCSLLLVTAGFGGLAALPYLGRTAESDAIAPPTPGNESAMILRLSEPQPTDFAPITERPLFTDVRRPPPPEAPGVPLANPDDDLLFGIYEITGVVLLGDSAIAMLRSKDGRLIRIRAGDIVETDEGEAELKSITLNALTFRRGADTVTAPVEREGARRE
jgi:hypothetical protein